MIQRFLYISRLLPDATPETVSQILRQSKERNRSVGITGALVFDGERFCQLIEGTPADIRELAAQIAIDSRHEQMTVLHENISDTPRLYLTWQAGYCEPGDLDPLDSRAAGDAQQALALFVAMLARFDLSH